jgi:hypothetical protein
MFQLRFWRAKEERQKRVRETSRREVDGRAGHNQHELRKDNQGTIDLSNNPVHHKRSKHIDVKYHYVR